VIRRLVCEAPQWLKPGAPLVLETFGGTQTGEVMDLVRAADFTDVITRQDLNGITRFVCGRRAAGGA
jgi:methylase of polypeptide subunit release factors